MVGWLGIIISFIFVTWMRKRGDKMTREDHQKYKNDLDFILFVVAVAIADKCCWLLVLLVVVNVDADAVGGGECCCWCCCWCCWWWWMLLLLRLLPINIAPGKCRCTLLYLDDLFFAGDHFDDHVFLFSDSYWLVLSPYNSRRIN